MTILDNEKGLRILPVKETAKRLSVARSTLYGFLDEKSPYFKPTLPKPIRLGSSVGFLEHEIDEYIRSLMAARRGE